jgi:prophage maintenance system killer protein
MGNDNSIAIFDNGEIHLSIRVDQANDTVWLTQQEIAKLFCVDRSVVSRHIINISKSGELGDTSSFIKEERIQTNNALGENVHNLYSLDFILAVGYRVNSKRGAAFRRWASSILKKYMIQGYALNEQRLIALQKQVKIFEIAARNEDLTTEQKSDFFDLLSDFEKGLILLDDYDHEAFPKKTAGQKDQYYLSYEECRKVIDELPFSKTSNLFGKERAEGLFKGSIGAIYQTFGGVDAYPTLESKAAHLLYFLVKDHGFLDGNKRIAATLFIYFLKKNHALYPEGDKKISPTTLAATTLLLAESKAEEMDLIISFTLGIIG